MAGDAAPKPETRFQGVPSLNPGEHSEASSRTLRSLPLETIPETIEQATESLTGLERLLTAKQWERAAIVYAFTRNGGKPGPK